MKNTFVSAPYASIEFATEQGIFEIIQYAKNIKTTDLDLNLISLNTNRDVGQDDCATFTVVLVYKDIWFKNIQGNDFMKIELGRGKELYPVFFGMVDSVYKSTSYIDLQPVRSITITGRGWNKALCQFDIGAVQEVEGSLSSIRGFYDGQVKLNSMVTPATAIQNVVDYYTDKGIDMEFANGKHRKDYFQAIYKDDGESEKYGNPSNAYAYQGSLWNYIKELRNAPFYEAFWEIYDENATFIVRPTPFNPDDWQSLQLIKVGASDGEIIETNLGRSDLETYSVFSVKGESIISEFNNILGAPIWYKPFYKRYGLRRLEVVSKYVKFNGNANIGSIYNSLVDGGANASLSFPTDPNVTLSSGFGPRVDPITGMTKPHNGVDLAGNLGDNIYAADAGKVKGIGYEAHEAGHYIILEHSSGLETRYYHLNKKPNLSVNENVSRGQKIGEMGSSGHSTGPHLHFEVRNGGMPVNPGPYIGLKEESNSGGTGSPSPDPISDSVKFDVAEKEPTEYEEWLEEGKKDYDELNRLNADAYKEHLKKQGDIQIEHDPKTGKVNINHSTKKERLEKGEEAERQTEAMIAEANNSDSSGTSQKTIDLFNWNIKNGIMENGSITLRGNAIYKVGTRLLIESTNMEYYIEKVSHSFVYNDGWKTTLQVTRGLPYGERFKEPWNQRSLITDEDVREISGLPIENINFMQGAGMMPTPIIFDDPTGFRAHVGMIAKSHAGEAYDQSTRMNDGISDCSSFVYKVTMEALGRDWHGTWAPATYTMPESDLWYQIPLSEVQPWDILLRDGHTEFLGDDGRTYGAHTWGTPAGPGAVYDPNNWTWAYRIKGL